MKIAIFKPQNIHPNNAFGIGEHPLFSQLGKKLGAEVVYFTDDPQVSFPGIRCIALKTSFLKTWIQKFGRRIGRRFYAKIPFYRDVDLAGYDWVITEGIHYPLLKYLEGFKGRVVLHDSISTDYALPQEQRDYLNTHFASAQAVAVNAKIPLLYKSNDLHLPTLVLGHGIDMPAIPYRLRTSWGQGRLVCVGRLSEEKGYDYLLEAMALLKNQKVTFSLDIYGRGPSEPELKALIQKMNLKDQVYLKGHLPHAQLLQTLNTYDVFVSHPVSMSYVAEAFHLGNMEALANGLPVITTDCGGIPWVVKEYARQVPQRNAQALATALLELKSNPGALESLSAKSRTYVETTYSVDVVLKQWLSLMTAQPPAQGE